MTRGMLDESAIKPVAIMNGIIAFPLILVLTRSETTIGVRISAVPSFAKNADMTAPRSMRYTNILFPLPLANLAK